MKYNLPVAMYIRIIYSITSYSNNVPEFGDILTYYHIAFKLLATRF